MRWTVLAVALAAAGCMAPPTDNGQALAEGGVFVVNGDQLAPAGNAPWVTIANGSAGQTYTFDWLQLLDVDLMAFVLVQALAGVDIDAENEMSVEYQPGGTGNEGGAPADFCLLDLGESRAPGAALLARAQGETVRIPDRTLADRNASWIIWTAGGSPVPIVSYGFGNGMGGFKRHFDAGEWGLLVAGMSGIPITELRAEPNRWEGTFQVSGPVRFVVLTPAQFRCGAGFTRFDGATAASPAYVGGQLAGQDRYGLTVTFRSDALTGNGDLPLLGNEGQLRFGDEVVPLHGLSNVWRTTYQPLEGAIENTRWVGSPRWMIAGYSVPHPPEVGLDGGNVTTAAAWR